jgi:hypothetical protein
VGLFLAVSQRVSSATSTTGPENRGSGVAKVSRKIDAKNGSQSSVYWSSRAGETLLQECDQSSRTQRCKPVDSPLRSDDAPSGGRSESGVTGQKSNDLDVGPGQSIRLMSRIIGRLPGTAFPQDDTRLEFPTFGVGPERVLKYLGALHAQGGRFQSAAVVNRRWHASFVYKDYADNNRAKPTTLAATEFIWISF